MKQRIIGLIILIGIALIFLPILFTRLESAESATLHAGDNALNSLTPAATPHQQSSRQPAATLQAAQNEVIYQQNPVQPVATAPTVAPEQVTEAPTNTAPVTSPTAAPLPAAPEPPTMLTTPVTTPTAAPPIQAVEQPAASAPAPAEVAVSANPAQPASPATANNPADNNPNSISPSAIPPNETENSQPNNNEAPPQTNDINPPNAAPPQPPADVQPIPTAPPPDNVSNTMAASEASILHLTSPAAHRKTARHASAKKPPAAKPETHVALTTAAKNPVTSSAPKGRGWIVQIGSFAQETHVEKLIQQLHAHGFVAQVMPLHTSHGTMTRVYLGPEKQRAQADDIARQLREQLTIQSIVVSIK